MICEVIRRIKFQLAVSRVTLWLIKEYCYSHSYLFLSLIYILNTLLALLFYQVIYIKQLLLNRLLEVFVFHANLINLILHYFLNILVFIPLNNNMDLFHDSFYASSPIFIALFSTRSASFELLLDASDSGLPC
jgi:hypothetical protein